MIQDAAGRRVTAYDPVGMHLLRRYRAIPEAPLKAIAEEVDRKWAKFGRAIALFYVLVLLLCYAGMTYYRVYISRSPSWDLVGVLFYVGQFALLAGAFVGVWLAGKWGRVERVRLVMLKHCRCPHCAYDLRGLVAERQDVTTGCPECGCTWQVKDPTADQCLAADAARRQSLESQNKRLVLVAFAVSVILVGITTFQVFRTRTAGSRAVVTPPAAPTGTTTAPSSTADHETAAPEPQAEVNSPPGKP